MKTNIESEATVPILNLEIHNTEGAGPTTAKKLKEAGIVSVMALAVTSSDDLSVDLNSSKESAAAFIKAAQKLLRDSNLVQKEFVTADAALDRRSENNRSFIYYCN
jgi:DNA repair protein RadA